MNGVRLSRLRDRLDAVHYPSAAAPPALTRLFADGLRVGADAVRTALSPAGLDDCIALGLVDIDSETAVARYRLVDHDGFLLALDPPECDSDPLQVMPPSGSTRTVLLAMHREPCEAALDLGCGCGLLALFAARYACHVIATDANSGATRLTELSAGLNRLTNVETRVGSWFEPVADTMFDRIVCNPPFVVSPESSRLYRDSGLAGDGVSRMIVETLPNYLRAGGVGHVLVNWIVREGNDPSVDWTAAAGCEVRFEPLPTYDSADYARHWLGDRADGPAFDEWMAYYRQLDVTAIGSGVVTLVKSR